MRRFSFCAVVLVLVGLVAMAYAQDDGNGPQNALLKLMSKFDLTDNSEFSQAVREQSIVKSVGQPRIDIISPAPGDSFAASEVVDGVPVILALTDWDFRPDLAVNAGTQFANGSQVSNQGHLHVWIEDEVGDVVVFLGAGAREEQLVFLDPGAYKAYAQLQNHDHTPQVTSRAPVRAAFDAVSFEVVAD